MGVEPASYSGPIVTRAEAKAAGLTRYFTGKPWPKGHLSERWVASYTCDSCQREYVVVRYAKDPESVRAKVREWWRVNLVREREKARLRSARKYTERRAYMLSYVEANRERVNAYNRARFAAASHVDREIYRVQVRNRRARRKQNGGKHTAKQIRDLLIKQRTKCANCRVSLKRGYHVDHIMPLAKGGSNDIKNLQLLCAPCNQRKFAKDPFDWAWANGRLL